MKVEEVALSLGTAYSAFPNLALTPEVVGAWFALFAEVDIQVFTTALFAAIREPGRKFFPAPGEVQPYIDRALAPTESSPEEEFSALRRLAASGLDEKGVEEQLFGRPDVLRAVKAIGWNEFRYGQLDQESFRRHRFVSLLKELREDRRKVQGLTMFEDRLYARLGMDRTGKRPAAIAGAAARLGLPESSSK